MDAQAAFREALEAGDVAAVRRLHGIVMPHLPAPKSDVEAEITMHMARTAMAAITPKARYWSHAWLTERAYPSQLPDRLRPSAERMFPRIVEGVGISVNFSSSLLKPAAKLIQKAMGDAVEDAYANGDRDPILIKARMAEARAKESKALFGGLVAPRG